jgi:hypothetical protein
MAVEPFFSSEEGRNVILQLRLACLGASFNNRPALSLPKSQFRGRAQLTPSSRSQPASSGCRSTGSAGARSGASTSARQRADAPPPLVTREEVDHAKEKLRVYVEILKIKLQLLDSELTGRERRQRQQQQDPR